MPAVSPNIEFYQASDGRRLAVRVWRPSERPRTRVLFLHGITSHGGWYNRSCEYLANAGHEAHFLDRRGSGLNVEARGDVDRWQTWVDDVAVYLRRCQVSGVRYQSPLTPDTRHLTPILCGISWGGKLAAAVARRHPGLLSGLGLICPGLYSPHEPGVLKRLALAGPMPARLAKRRVRIPLADPALFTDSPRGREFIGGDPLSLRTITWRFAREDRKLTRYARQAASFLHMPALLMLAGQDRIVANQSSRAYFSRVAGQHKTLFEYPNAAHTLEFESEPSRYFADLAEWIERTSACGSARGC
jgi:acylglycerol lipase